MLDAGIRVSKLHDITHFGIRLVIGAIFIIQGSGKFNPGFVGFLSSISIPAEMQIPIALAEVVSGILIVVGVLSRISSSLLSIIMLGAIFYVKQASKFMGEGGFALDLMLLATSLTIVAIGPGRISLSHLVKKLPRFLQ